MKFMYNKLRINKNERETLAEYAARVREKSEHCEFSNTTDERILELIIQTIDIKGLIIRTRQKKMGLVEILRRIRPKK